MEPGPHNELSQNWLSNAHWIAYTLLAYTVMFSSLVAANTSTPSLDPALSRSALCTAVQSHNLQVNKTRNGSVKYDGAHPCCNACHKRFYTFRVLPEDLFVGDVVLRLTAVSVTAVLSTADSVSWQCVGWLLG